MWQAGLLSFDRLSFVSPSHPFSSQRDRQWLLCQRPLARFVGKLAAMQRQPSLLLSISFSNRCVIDDDSGLSTGNCYSNSFVHTAGDGDVVVDRTTTRPTGHGRRRHVGIAAVTTDSHFKAEKPNQADDPALPSSLIALAGQGAARRRSGAAKKRRAALSRCLRPPVSHGTDGRK